MIVLIDNYDSFAHNVARYLERLAGDIVCLRNDVATPDVVERLEPKLIVLSPGPGTPRDAGHSLDIVNFMGQRIPMLGICLGYQVIVEAFGGTILATPNPVHGMASLIQHDQAQEFQDLPNPFAAGRYHSLVADPDQLPSCLTVTATTRVADLVDDLAMPSIDDQTIGRTTDGSESIETEITTAMADRQLVMAIRHRSLPIFGWQFHPESILTDHGYDLLSNLLGLVDLPTPDRVPTIHDERVDATAGDSPHPKLPITF